MVQRLGVICIGLVLDAWGSGAIVNQVDLLDYVVALLAAVDVSPVAL